MWWFRRNRNPWKKIGEDLKSLIDFLDTEAVDKLVEQGEDDKAFQTRLIAIRLASMLANHQIAEEMVSKAKQLLDSQTSAGMTALQQNGHGDKERGEQRTRIEVRDQLGHCSIQNAAVRSI